MSKKKDFLLQQLLTMFVFRRNALRAYLYSADGYLSLSLSLSLSQLKVLLEKAKGRGPILQQRLHSSKLLALFGMVDSCKVK